MTTSPETRRYAASGLIATLLCVGLGLGVGLAVKEPCAQGGRTWDDGRPYRWFCYSDIVALYDTEHLASGRLPYLDQCPERAGVCDEYPVLTMYAMRAAAEPVTTHRAFFHMNAAMLAVAGAVVAAAAVRLRGRSALLLGLSPTLALYGFMNWDLLAVAAATLATVAVVRGRERQAGVWLGLGIAAKAYPALLLIPFVLHIRSSKRGTGRQLCGWTGATWLILNLPFAIGAFTGWSTFFRFNLNRHIDFDSLWYVACRRLGGTGSTGSACVYEQPLQLVGVALFVVSAVVVYRLRRTRAPDFERWTFGLPLLALFLLTSKVYSPQYTLWILPWIFILDFPRRLPVSLGLAEVALFLARFSYLGTVRGLPGVEVTVFDVTLLIRAAVLVWLIVAWVQGARVPRDCDQSSVDSATVAHASVL